MHKNLNLAYHRSGVIDPAQLEAAGRNRRPRLRGFASPAQL
jgi:hypothetical protein